MKKTLIALAVLATAGTAFAQSTVSLTGLVGAAAQSFDTRVTPAVAPSQYSLGSPATGGSRQRGIALTDATIKIGVTEDLGGGLKAAANIQFDSIGSTSDATFGKGLLRRNTSVSLTGGFGQVSFTNTRSGNLLTRGMVAPSNLYLGIYDGSGVITRSPVDALTYGMKFGDFTGSVQYVESALDGEWNAAVKVGVLNAGYAKGPIAAGVAVKMYNFRNPTTKANAERKNRLEAFATYDLGVAKFGVGYDGPNVGLPNSPLITDASAWAVGVSAPLGPVTIGANYAKRDANKVTELAADYALSKRTSFNASLGRQTANKGTDNGNQYRLGVYHSF